MTGKTSQSSSDCHAILLQIPSDFHRQSLAYPAQISALAGCISKSISCTEVFVLLFFGYVCCLVLRSSYVVNYLGLIQHVKLLKNKLLTISLSNQQLWFFVNIPSLAAFTATVKRLHCSLIHTKSQMGKSPLESYPLIIIPRAFLLVELLTDSSTYGAVTSKELKG